MLTLESTTKFWVLVGSALLSFSFAYFLVGLSGVFPFFVLILVGVFLYSRDRVMKARAEVLAARQLAEEMGQEHWVYLAEASRALGSNLDYDETLEKAASLLVPDLADECTVDVMDHDGCISRAFARSASSPSRTVSGRVRLTLDELSPALRGVLSSTEGRERSCALDSAMTVTVPLISRNHVLGAMTFTHSRPGFSYGRTHRHLAEVLASRCAMAIDNARLYSDSQREVRGRERMLAMISHDLKNSVTAIDLSAHLLLGQKALQGDGAARSRLLTARILESSGRMNLLINNLLDAAKIRFGTFRIATRSVPLGPILQEAYDFASILSADKGISIELKVENANVDVLADTESLFRVFSNLFGNAIKFTPRDGRITLSAHRDLSQIVISVEDSGPGIPTDCIPYIFEDFWQNRDTAHLGTGLGLPIAKGIVEEHGGKLWVECPPSGGSIFRFTLPITP